MDRLSEYFGIGKDELEKRRLYELKDMVRQMEEDKVLARNNRNAGDSEYERLVLKYFTPLPFLREWFSEKEVVLACALTGVTENNLCEEAFVSPGNERYDHGAEYIRMSVEYVPKFDSKGNQLMFGERKMVDVYRRTNHYQGLCHGKVILHLLYSRYPSLEEFKFNAYEMYSCEDTYEIYPDNGIYVPFVSLMAGDVDAIIYRNREYCRFYNHGEYAPEILEERLRTPGAARLFDMVLEIGKRERAMGHFPVTADENGKYIRGDGLVEAGTSASGNVKLLARPYKKGTAYPTKPFALQCSTPLSVGRLVDEYLGMAESGKVTIHVYHVRDHAGKYGINVEAVKGSTVNPVAYHYNGTDCSGHEVCSAYGWTGNGTEDLVIRIDCPKLGEKEWV